MKIIDITQTDVIQDSIKILKQGKSYDGDNNLDNVRKQYNVLTHDTFDRSKLKDKPIYTTRTNDKGEEVEEISSYEKVNRVAFPFQQRIVNSAVSFTFGNPVNMNCQPKDESERLVLQSIDRILYDNKINSFNRKVARDLFRSKEVAEIWFTAESETHSSFGFDTKYKVKGNHFSPWDNNELYPYFDETGNLLAFSRNYKLKKESKEVEFFDVYTDEQIVKWQRLDGAWIELSNVPNPIKKIPVVFATQDEVEWSQVQNSIDRLELLLSNFAETNDYFAAPKVFISGEIVRGLGVKGEGGQVIQGTDGATAEIISWNHATDAVKLEIETLIKFIHSLTQTPDFSFENLKGMNQVSGVALRMLFMDAHLKVHEKREVLDEYLQRRTNIILSFIPLMNNALKKACENIQITAEIVPYMIDDIETKIDMLVAANGGKSVISQQSSVKKAGLASDSEYEWELLKDEASADNQTAIGDTVI